MSTHKIYLAGPMSGLPQKNFPAFFAEADRLRAQGHHVINPAEIGLGLNATWADFMRADIREMLTCNEVLMLRGWEASKGAQLEHHIAKELGLEIVFQEPAKFFTPPALDHHSVTEAERIAIKRLRNKGGWWEGDSNALQVLREYSAFAVARFHFADKGKPE